MMMMIVRDVRLRIPRTGNVMGGLETMFWICMRRSKWLTTPETMMNINLRSRCVLLNVGKRRKR